MDTQTKDRTELDAMLVAVAERLGVEPEGENDPTPLVSFKTEDGRKYSWVKLLYAHLKAMG